MSILDKRNDSELLKNLTAEMLDYKDKWLQMSGFTEEQFIEYRTVGDFTVEAVNTSDNQYRIIRIGYKSNNEFIQIGEQIAYKIGDDENCVNMCLLLFCLGKLLDTANETAPQFEKRDKYFFNIIEQFVREETKSIEAIN